MAYVSRGEAMLDGGGERSRQVAGEKLSPATAESGMPKKWRRWGSFKDVMAHMLRQEYAAYMRQERVGQAGVGVCSGYGLLGRKKKRCHKGTGRQDDDTAGMLPAAGREEAWLQAQKAGAYAAAAGASIKG